MTSIILKEGPFQRLLLQFKRYAYGHCSQNISYCINISMKHLRFILIYYNNCPHSLSGHKSGMKEDPFSKYCMKTIKNFVQNASPLC